MVSWVGYGIELCNFLRIFVSTLICSSSGKACTLRNRHLSADLFSFYNSVLHIRLPLTPNISMPQVLDTLFRRVTTRQFTVRQLILP